MNHTFLGCVCVCVCVCVSLCFFPKGREHAKPSESHSALAKRGFVRVVVIPRWVPQLALPPFCLTRALKVCMCAWSRIGTLST